MAKIGYFASFDGEFGHITYFSGSSKKQETPFVFCVWLLPKKVE